MAGNIKDASQTELELIKFKNEDASIDIDIDINFDFDHETIWATQQQMAELFGRDSDTIGDHIKVIFQEGELVQDATTGKFPVVRNEGNRRVTREILHYNLDMILSVGYRVSSNKATEFRKWATKILRSYIVDGFALNESRLRNDPNALQELAAKVRALRADEKNIYQAVRDVFAFGSIDYNKDSPLVRSFYAKLQDKFLVATTGRTASQIKLDRADHTQPNMGLTSMKGDAPCASDIQTGKNYLKEEELHYLHILCEQFLLFVESKAIRGQQLTMKELDLKFDQLLELQGHQIFTGYKDYLAEKAKNHAKQELFLWKEKNKTQIN